MDWTKSIKWKHTPGPWQMTENGIPHLADDYPYAIRPAGMVSALALVSHGGGSYHPTGDFNGEARANAAIIERATYMLTALEEILAEYQNGFHTYTAGISFAEHAVQLIREAAGMKDEDETDDAA